MTSATEGTCTPPPAVPAIVSTFAKPVPVATDEAPVATDKATVKTPKHNLPDINTFVTKTLLEPGNSDHSTNPSPTDSVAMSFASATDSNPKGNSSAEASDSSGRSSFESSSWDNSMTSGFRNTYPGVRELGEPIIGKPHPLSPDPSPSPSLVIYPLVEVGHGSTGTALRCKVVLPISGWGEEFEKPIIQTYRHSIVMKIPGGGPLDGFFNEIELYEGCLSHTKGPWPEWYGYYKQATQWQLMIIEDAGEVVDLQTLNHTDKLAVVDVFKQLHNKTIVHGDFYGKNIARHPTRGFVVFDFSHSYRGTPEQREKEMKDLKRWMKLDS